MRRVAARAAQRAERSELVRALPRLARRGQQAAAVVRAARGVGWGGARTRLAEEQGRCVGGRGVVRASHLGAPSAARVRAGRGGTARGRGEGEPGRA